MWNEELDRASWLDARLQGRYGFIEERASHVGVVLGLVLAGWSAMVDASLGYPLNRLLLESTYFFSGSVGLTGLAALLEWEFLERRFGSARGFARAVRS